MLQWLRDITGENNGGLMIHGIVILAVGCIVSFLLLHPKEANASITQGPPAVMLCKVEQPNGGWIKFAPVAKEDSKQTDVRYIFKGRAIFWNGDEIYFFNTQCIMFTNNELAEDFLERYLRR